METKYVNPFTDFGFKKLFGEEASKPALIDFLNSLLPADTQIKDLSFKNTEQLGQNLSDRKAVYDIYCEGEKGEKFIVELQKAKQDYFRERMLYYATFPIAEQALKGDNWNFDLKAVYCIGILDFIFNDYKTNEPKNIVFHDVRLRYPDGKVFYDKLNFIYLEMPNFHKTEDELETRLDKWLFFIKNLRDFQDIPRIFKNEVVFLSAFEKAEVARYSPEERASYEYSLKVYRDIKNVIDSAAETARKEGIAEGLEVGIAEGKAVGITVGKTEMAKALKAKGLSIDLIIETSGLSREKIEKL